MKKPNDLLLHTESTLRGTPGYFPTSKFKNLTKFHDYYNFGVVIRELLTGLHPKESVDGKILRKMDDSVLKDKIQKKIWRNDELSAALLTLANDCVKSTKQQAAANTFKISDMLIELDSLIRDKNAEKWTGPPAEECEKCEVCVVNNCVKESKYLDHELLCQKKINVCASCMRNSFLNPIMCHTCGNKVRPFI
ncbi:hypothetical protein MAR_014876, partial [Mya arenaria]